MPDQRKYILWGVLCLTAWFFIENSVYKYLPEVIPQTKIRVNGALIFIGIFLTILIVFKRVLKQHPQASIGFLVVLGTLIIGISELIFQTYFQFTLPESEPTEKVLSLLSSLGISCLIGVLISLSEAVNLKYKRSGIAFAVNIVCIGVMILVLKYFGLPVFPLWQL